MNALLDMSNLKLAEETEREQMYPRKAAVGRGGRNIKSGILCGRKMPESAVGKSK